MTQEFDTNDAQTASELVPEHKLAGIDQHWNTSDEWDGHDYSSVPIPTEDQRPKWEWSPKERRAYILTLLRKYGHAGNVPRKQTELAEDFGVTQTTIWRDYNELRRFIRFHAGDRAVSDTEMVAQKAVREELSDGNHYKALRAQLEYNEWLFELGRLDRAPERRQTENINVTANLAELDPEEESHLADLADKLERGQKQGDDVVDVEATEVRDDE